MVQDDTLDVFLVEYPTRGDGQDWDGSHLLELLLNESLSPVRLTKIGEMTMIFPEQRLRPMEE
jgi:hypothetical protein